MTLIESMCAAGTSRISIPGRGLGFILLPPPMIRTRLKSGRFRPTRQESSFFTYPVAAGIVLSQAQRNLLRMAVFVDGELIG